MTTTKKHEALPKKTLRILVIDDEEIVRKEIRDFLSFYAYDIEEAATPSQAFALLDEKEVDIVILDVRLPEMDGIDVLERIKKTHPHIEVIIITGHGETETVIQAMRGGAFDFFRKPIQGVELKNAIERTNKYITLATELERQNRSYSLISKDLQKNIGNIIGVSDAMKAVVDLTMKAAETPDTPVLITGPSGSGKELIAQVIHFASARKGNPFCPINCSALPDTLIESELFGYKKGAFSGATEDRPGYLEASNGGTVFLDEIGDMELPTQAKILRVLEEKKVTRIGSRRETPIDVRIVSATNKDVLAMMHENVFRSDLFYRINTIEIRLPPLAERPEDIPLLLDYYVKEYAKKLGKPLPRIHDEVYDAFCAYPFPGNVRELKNIVERALIINDADELRLAHVPFRGQVREPVSQATKQSTALPTLNLAELETRAIAQALQETDHNKTRAAELLDISIYALSRKMVKYGLEIKKGI